jgi:hypothetical protein
MVLTLAPAVSASRHVAFLALSTGRLQGWAVNKPASTFSSKKTDVRISCALAAAVEQMQEIHVPQALLALAGLRGS